MISNGEWFLSQVLQPYLCHESPQGKLLQHPWGSLTDHQCRLQRAQDSGPPEGRAGLLSLPNQLISHCNHLKWCYLTNTHSTNSFRLRDIFLHHSPSKHQPCSQSSRRSFLVHCRCTRGWGSWSSCLHQSYCPRYSRCPQQRALGNRTCLHASLSLLLIRSIVIQYIFGTMTWLANFSLDLSLYYQIVMVMATIWYFVSNTHQAQRQRSWVNPGPEVEPDGGDIGVFLHI